MRSFERGYRVPVSKRNPWGEVDKFSLYLWFRSFFPDSWHYLDCRHKWGPDQYYWRLDPLRCSHFESCIKCGRARKYAKVEIPPEVLYLTEKNND